MQDHSTDNRTDSAASLDADLSVIMPTYADHLLKGLSAEDLVELLIENEDHVPLNLIEECARRGADMEELLLPLFDSPIEDIEHDGQWWLRLHSVNILGLMPSGSAGAGLIEAMHCLTTAETDDLYEWCTGYWHVWFRNKPDATINKLRGALADRQTNLLLRIHLIECLAGVAAERDLKLLDSMLETFARFAADQREDHSLRMMSCLQLLDFPRERYRGLLEKIVRDEKDDADFAPSDIQDRYDSGEDDPESAQSGDPLTFYSPEEIQRRQSTVEDESLADELGEDDEPFSQVQTHVRETPKAGRNDPCPCGSGKKYKKCCLS